MKADLRGPLRQWLQAGGVVLTGLFLSSGCRPAPDPIPHVPGLTAYHYDVSIDVNMEAESIRARAEVFLTDAEVRSSLRAWISGVAVDSILSGGRHVPFRRSGRKLDLTVPAPGDSLSLVFYYAGQPAEGLYFTSSGGSQFVYTDSWPERVTGWLPVLTHPAAGTTARLSVTVPHGRMVAASGTLQDRSETPESVTYVYDLGRRAPLFAVAFAAGPFRIDTTGYINGGPIRAFLPSGSAGAAPAAAPGALAYFSEWIGDYPYETYGEAYLPMHHLGMENAAMSFLRSTLLDDPYTDFFERLEAVAVHEAAHQWFGNSVRPADWWDLWLSEGFATYLTLLYFEDRYGEGAMRSGLLDLSRRAVRSRRHAAVVMPGQTGPEDHLSWVTYRKGASVLHLLRLRMGDEAFRSLIGGIYSRFADSNASTAQVIEYIDSVGSEPLSDLFLFWLYERRLPVLRTEWDAQSGVLSWRIENDRGTLQGVPFELRISQGGRSRFVLATDHSVRLEGWDDQKPNVLPAGVFLFVE